MPYRSDFLSLGSGAIALFAAAVLPLLPLGPRRSRILLSALLALLSTFGLGAHMSANGGFEAHPHLMRVGSTLGMAFMPLLYLYARALACPERPIQALDAWHAAPLLLQTLLRLPFFLQSGATKLGTMVDPRDALLNRAGLLLLALGYGLALIRLHRRHQGRLPQEHSRLEGRRLTWVLILYLSWAVIPVLELAPLLVGPLPPFLSPTAAASNLLTILTAYLGLTQPHLAPSVAARGTVPPTVEPEGQPPRQGLLSPEREAEILARVLAFVDREAPHLDPELSLADLAGRLRLPPAYISRALNNGLGQNFFTFVNARRVEAAGRLLLKRPDRPVLEVALETGFSSKSTFNSVFKKLTGLTPSEYRKARPDSGRTAS